MSVVNIYDRRKMQKRPKQYKFLSSQNFEVPPGYKSCDIFCVGGGAAGASAAPINTKKPQFGQFLGGGGAGGFCKTTKGITINPKDILEIKIGDGGKAFLSETMPPGYKQSYSDYIGYYYFNGNASNMLNAYEKMPSFFYKIIGVLHGGVPELDYSTPIDFPMAGEDSYVKNITTNKRIAEGKGSMGYFFIGQHSNFKDILLWNGYSNVFYKINPKNMSGGNLGGTGVEQVLLDEESHNRYFVGSPGESNGGRFLITDNDYPFWSILRNPPDNRLVRWNAGPSVGTVGGEGPTPRLRDTITDLRILRPTYDDLFNKGDINIRCNFVASGGGVGPHYWSETHTFSNKWIFGNQNTLSPWLGQSNTKAFGEENEELFAGAGGGIGIWPRNWSELTQSDINKIGEAFYGNNGNHGGNGGGGNGARPNMVKTGNDWHPVEYPDPEQIKGQDGAPNTGGGGGAGGSCNSYKLYFDGFGPGNGGSGIVIIRFYPNENRNIDVNWDENTETK